MEKNPDQPLIYIITERKFKRLMWTYFFLWIALRIVRTILYFTVGITYLSSIPAAFIFFGTGVLWGFAILTVVIYKRSCPPEPGVEIREEPHHH